MWCALLQSTIETRGLGFPKQGPWHDRLVATIQNYGILVNWSPVAAKRARDAYKWLFPAVNNRPDVLDNEEGDRGTTDSLLADHLSTHQPQF